MQGGGFMAEENTRGDNATNHKFRERGGMIPITAKILHDSSVNQEEAVEYQGNLLSDVSIVGYLKSYNETDTKVIVRIWDQTGVVETVFYNKNENETHSGLTNFTFLDTGKLVKIFGTVKTYKKEKNLQGAKIMYVNDNELIYHQLEVVNDWLYLTGKINTLKEQSAENYNNDVKNLARNHYGNSNSNYYGGNSNSYGNNSYMNNNNNSYNNNRNNDYNPNPHFNNTESIVMNTLKELIKTRGTRIQSRELYQVLEKKNISHAGIANSLRSLNEGGYVFEEEDCYFLQ